MKKIVVLSDNPDLASAVKNIIINQNLNLLAKFDFYYSKVNQNPRQMAELGFAPLDIKQTDIVDSLIQEASLILSMHCKQIFPAKLISSVRCINLHPGLNPFNRGWYPQVFSLINKLPCGATLHVMNEEVDAGPIIVQEKVVIESFDTSLSLYKKIQKVEIQIIEQYLSKLISDEYLQTIMPEPGNYNSRKDFENLCELDLSHEGTLGEHIDLLRALTHGQFKNAHFKNRNGNKIYIQLKLINGNENTND